MRAITSALTATLTISTVVLGVVLGFAAAQQEPYPGQSEHKEPPAGWTCSRDADDRAHLCFCSGMQKNDDPMCKKAEPEADDPNTEEDESMPAEPPEDPKCTVWCHKSHCTCKQFCDT